MNQDLVDVLASISVAGKITSGDIVRLRDGLWTEELLSQATVDALFDLHRRCPEAVDAWTDLLIEAVEHYLIHQTPPFGFLDEPGAQWLRGQIGRNRGVVTWPEMALLVSVLEAAENAPEWLKVWTLSQIEQTIVTGVGPTRDPESIAPNCVDAAEVDLLRRLIFAGGGEGAVVVGALEADMLFRIKERTLHSANAPEWLTLFVQGVGNHLMAHSDYRPLARDEAERLNAFMDDNLPSLGGFLSRTLPGHMRGKGTIIEAFKAIFAGTDAPTDDAANVAASHALTVEEAGWLKQQIVADGQTDAYEKALLTFVVEEAGNVPSMIESLRRRA